MAQSEMVCTIKMNIFVLLRCPHSEPTFNIVKHIFTAMLDVS
jgi:hypothetical protein